MEIYRKQFGKKLHEAISERGIKQFQLAATLGVKPSTVSRWINGHDFPEDDRRLEAICAAIGKDKEYFTREKDQVKNGIDQLKNLLIEVQLAEANRSLPGDLGDIVKILSTFERDDLLKARGMLESFARTIARRSAKRVKDLG